MLELADRHGSEPCALRSVRVHLPLLALTRRGMPRIFALATRARSTREQVRIILGFKSSRGHLLNYFRLSFCTFKLMILIFSGRRYTHEYKQLRYYLVT